MQTIQASTKTINYKIPPKMSNTFTLTALCVLFLSTVAQCSFWGRTQSAAVKGRLRCGDLWQSGIKVRLYDDDDGLDPDDKLDEGYTDSQGYFSLAGTTDELTPIDPELKIYHDCNDGAIPCQRKWIIEIPNKYITSGKKPNKTMDLGEVNLEVELDDEDRDCLN